MNDVSNTKSAGSMISKRALIATASAAALASLQGSTASAATNYWDPLLTHTGTGSGGTGTWDTSTANWYASGAVNTTWGSDIAQFRGTAGTVSVAASGVSATELLFNTTGYTIGGSGTITMTGAIPSIAWGSGGSVMTDTISASLAGSNGLIVQTHTVSHVLNLSGANSYLGTTTNNGASIVLSNTNASLATVLNGGSLKLDFASATPTSNLMNSASTLTLGYGSTFNVTSKAGTPNSQTLGGLTVGTGGSTLTIVNGAGGSAAVDLGTITRNVGGTANFVQPTVNTTISATNGYVTSNVVDAYGLLGPGLTVGGNDWATKSGTNIVALPSASYTTENNVANWADGQHITNSAGYTGSIAADRTIGSLRLHKANSGTIGLGSSTLTVADGILLTSTVATNTTTISGGTLKGAAGKDLVIIQNSASVLNISSTIADNTTATGLTKSGSGVLTLSGPNSYSGATYINGGTLNINNDDAVGTGALNLAGGTTLDNTSGSPVTLPASNSVVLGTPGSSSSLTYTGTGGSALKIGAAGILINYTTAVENTANSGHSFSFNVNGGTLDLAGNVTPTGTGYYNYQILKQGAGTLVLSGANTLPGLPQTATGKILHRGGTLALNNPLALGAGGLNIQLFGSPSVAIDNTTAGPMTLSNSPAMSIAVSFSFNGTQDLNYGNGGVALNTTNPVITVLDKTLTLGGVISGNNALNGFTKAGPGTLAVGGVSTYTGPTSITGGKLSILSTGRINATSGITINGGELNYNSATALNKPVTFTAGKVSGTGSIGVALDGGTGTTIAPGNSAGVLTSTSTVTMADAAIFEVEIGGTSANLTTGVTDYDILKLTNAAATTLDLNGSTNLGNAILDVSLINGFVPSNLVASSFVIVDNTSSTGSQISSLFRLANGTVLNDNDTFLIGGTTFQISYNVNGGLDGNSASNDIVLTTVVPEPATLAAFGLVVAGMLRRNRRSAN